MLTEGYDERSNLYIGNCIIAKENVVIGSNNEFYNCSIGLPPEQRGHSGFGAYGVEIGDYNVFREYVTIHAGLENPTTIGDHNFLMIKSHIAHDTILGDYVTISPGACFAGHCIVGDHVTIGMNASIHQRLEIGKGAMIGMGAVVTKDVEPYAKVYGNPAKQHGFNEKKREELDE